MVVGDDPVADRLVGDDPFSLGDDGLRTRLTLRAGLEQEDVVRKFYRKGIVRAVNSIDAVGQLFRGWSGGCRSWCSTACSSASALSGRCQERLDIRRVRVGSENVSGEGRPAAPLLHDLSRELQAVGAIPV